MSEGLTGSLRAITAWLEASRIPYMVVGSFASTFHGEPRTTRDLDIVVDPSAEALEAFLERIDLDAFYVDLDTARDALRRRTMFNIVDMNTAWKIDLVIRKDRAFSIEELSRRSPARIVDVDVPIASAEDTILSKLEWAKDSGSDRQITDVAGILHLREDTLDRAYLEKWIDELGLRDVWHRTLARR